MPRVRGRTVEVASALHGASRWRPWTAPEGELQPPAALVLEVVVVGPVVGVVAGVGGPVVVVGTEVGSAPG